MILKIENLSKSFGNHEVLKNVNLAMDKGEIIAVIGSSGSGKSTMLRCINGLVKPTSGIIEYEGRVGMVFQHFNLFPHMTCLQNITYAQIKVLKRSKAEAKSKADKLLSLVGLLDQANKYPSQISGGQKQRLAIARAIVGRPQILFADEPTGALDSISRNLIFESLRKMADEGKCVLMVTHDIELASKTDKAFILKDGYISQEITNPSAEELYQALETIGK